MPPGDRRGRRHLKAIVLTTRESLFRSVVDEITTTVYPRTGHRAALHAPSAFGIELTIVNLRTLTVDIPPQDVITKDNVTLRVNAVTYFNVVDPVRSVVAVQDHGFATFQIAQTTLRSILGQVELDDLLEKRDEINTQLQQIVDDVTNPWGVKVTLVEVKDVELPETMRRAMPPSRGRAGTAGKGNPRHGRAGGGLILGRGGAAA